MRRILVIASALALGCATVGKTFDTTHANDVQKGVHDKAQVRAWFGEPHQTTSPLPANPAGCVERWQWTHARSVVGGKTESQSLVIDFAANGKVCDHAFSRIQH